MNTSKTPYKIENLLNEASALYELFYNLVKNKNENANNLSKRLIKNFNLEGKHCERFQKISQKTAIAKEIVKTLEDKFGVNEQGDIIDLKGFCNLVIDGRISKNRKIKSYNIAFGHIQKNWKKHEYLGYVQGGNIIFQNSLLHLKKLIDKNTLVDNCAFGTYLDKLSKKYNRIEISDLILNMPNEEHIIKNCEELNFKEIENHELRHIFDKLVRDDENYYNASRFCETQADIYSSLSLRGLERDFSDFGKEDLERKIKIREDRIKNLKRIKAPELLIQDDESHLKEIKEKLNNRDYTKIDINGIINSLKNIPASKKEIKALSYFFSILPEDEAPHYLQKAREFYDERNKKQ